VGLEISIRQSDDVTILDLHGKALIGADSELLRSHLKELVANGARKLLLNLVDFTQIDSSGMSIIIRTCDSLRREGGDLRLLRPSGRVLEVFRVLHLLQVLVSFEDETQALASFRPRGCAASSS